MPAIAGTLGCADEYGVVLHWRGGGRQFAPQLPGVTGVDWDRVLSDTGEATVTVGKAGAGRECCRHLGRVEPWIHELSLYRDGPLVWQGPLVDVRETRSDITLVARDVSVWLDRRVTHRRHQWAGVDLVTAAFRIIEDALSPDDPNVLPHIVTTPAGVVTDWEEKPNRKVVFDQLRELVKQGMDFTCSGRSLLLGPETTVDDRAQARLDGSRILADIEVSRVGLDAATRVIGRGQGAQAAVGGVDGFFGLLETITRVSGAKTLAECRQAARVHLGQSNPPSLVVKVPGDATLDPSAPVPMSRLVPGGRFDVVLEDFCRPVSAAQRLAGVRVRWRPGETEQVGVSLTPMGVAAGAGVV